MCPFICPVCLEYIFIVPCFYCEDRAKLSTGIVGNIRSTQSEIETTYDIVEGNAPRNPLISNDSQMHENDTKSFKTLEQVMFSKEIFDPVGSISSVPGPSGFPENKDESNISTEKLYDTSFPQTNFFMDKYKKTFTCWVCKKKIDEHKKNDEGKTPYICCVCKYGADTRYKLQMHSRIHCAKIICKICSKYYTEGDSHEGKRNCIACEETFDCKSLLYQHYVLHEEDFKTRCWDCYTSIEKHFIPGESKKIYFCCICKLETPYLQNFLKHNHTHRRIVCKICNEKFSKTDIIAKNNNMCSDTEYKCTMCDEKYKCKHLLEDHYKNHKSDIKIRCILCKKNINNHGIMKKGFVYTCCECSEIFTSTSELRRHLYSHIDLQPFKCYVCGVRYKIESNLRGHLSNVCVPLPEKCDRCQARFPNSFLLLSHKIEKHW